MSPTHLLAIRPTTSPSLLNSTPRPTSTMRPLTKLLHSIFLTFVFFTAVAIATLIAVVLAVILASMSFCAFSTALVFAGIGRIKDWQRDPR